MVCPVFSHVTGCCIPSCHSWFCIPSNCQRLLLLFCLLSRQFALYPILSLVVLYSSSSLPAVLSSVFSSVGLYPVWSLIGLYPSNHWLVCTLSCQWLSVSRFVIGCVSRLVIGWFVPCLVICRFVPCLVIGCLYPVLSLVDLYPVLLLADQCLVLPSWLHGLYRKPEC